MSETEEERVRRYAEAARPYFGDAAARAVIAVADDEQAALRADLKSMEAGRDTALRMFKDARLRADAVEAEVERLTRECLDREAIETDARERLRQAEERLAAVEGKAGLHAISARARGDFEEERRWLDLGIMLEHWADPA